MFAALCSRFRRPVSNKPRQREVSQARPHLESLEERAAPAAMSASGPSVVDTAYMVYSQQGNEQEVILGMTAMQNATNPAVKQFGQTLFNDHWNSLIKEMSVLQQAGLPGLVPLSQDNMQNIQQFQNLHGNQFDTQFSLFMVQDHIEDILVGQLEQQFGSFQPATNYAAQDAPVLQKHLSIAESLVSQLTGFNMFNSGGNNNNQSGSNSQGSDSNSNSNQSGNGQMNQ